jgi:hypothetical protein
MIYSYLSPEWFYGYDAGFELAFALISLVVALFAFKIYRKTSQRLVRLFGFSFLLISISYFIESILNYLIVRFLNGQMPVVQKLTSIAGFEYIGILTHIVLMTIGLSILFYATLKEKRLRILWFLILIALSAILFNENTLYMFYLVSTIYLIFISWHFILNYLRNRQVKTLLIAAAFVFLLFGSFHFLISVNHQLFYVIGHILEFFAYAFILVNFYLVQRQ